MQNYSCWGLQANKHNCGAPPCISLRQEIVSRNCLGVCLVSFSQRQIHQRPFWLEQLRQLQTVPQRASWPAGMGPSMFSLNDMTFYWPESRYRGNKQIINNSKVPMNCPIPHYTTLSHHVATVEWLWWAYFPAPKGFLWETAPKVRSFTVCHWREKRMSWSHGMPGSNPTEGSFLDENSGFWFLFPRRTKKKRPFLGMNKGWSSIFYHILLYIKLRQYLIFWYILVKSSFLLV